jgi:hypothetical protein
MRLYLIALVIAFIGLWLSNEVQADGLCGLRSGSVLSVENWKAQGTKGAVDFTVTLRSKDNKAIRGVGGTVEFLVGDKPLMRLQIYMKAPLEPLGTTMVQSTERRTADAERLLDTAHDKVKALACIDSIHYVDGSGVIIN